jgi:L-aspartate oxidase
MALAAEIIAASALLRTESRGAHFRSDFPEPVAALQSRRAMTLAEIRAASRKAARSGAEHAALECPL